MKTNNTKVLRAMGLVFTVASPLATKLVVMYDSSKFWMHATINGDTYNYVSHPNMETFLKDAGVKPASTMQTASPSMAVIKSWPTLTNEMGIQPAELEGALRAYVDGFTMNEKLGLPIKEEAIVNLDFNTLITYDGKEYFNNLKNFKGGVDPKDYVSPLANPKEKLLLKASQANPVFKDVYEYVTHMYAGMPSKNILLHGFPGGGKTTIAQALAATLKVPYAMLPVSDTTTMEDMTMVYVPSVTNEGQMYFVELFTKFLRVYACGGVLVIDEANALNLLVQKFGNNVFYGDCHIALKGIDIPRHPNCIVIFTCNTGLVGDDPFLLALETRFRQFLVPKLSLEERVAYWYALYQEQVSKEYLTAFTHLCDAMTTALGSKDVRNDDDRHPDGPAFTSRAHLIMLGEWLSVKDSQDMKAFIEKQLLDYMGDIKDVHGHIAKIMGTLVANINEVLAKQLTAFGSVKDTDEGISPEELAALIAAMPVVTDEEYVYGEQTGYGMRFEFTGGRFGSSVELLYQNDKASFLETDKLNQKGFPEMWVTAIQAANDIVDNNTFDQKICLGVWVSPTPEPKPEVKTLEGSPASRFRAAIGR